MTCLCPSSRCLPLPPTVPGPGGVGIVIHSESLRIMSPIEGLLSCFSPNPRILFSSSKNAVAGSSQIGSKAGAPTYTGARRG